MAIDHDDISARRIGSAVHYQAVKRLIDLCASASALMFLAPLFVAIAVIIRATSRGPIFYWSLRAGRHSHPFRMPKFRTMHTGAPCVPTREIIAPHRWVTPVGRVLRRTSLDEIPQLWSVLKGDMSLIGPRALLVSETDILQGRRALGVDQVRPGITGWAQINGRDSVSAPQKIALDFEYVRGMSLGMDLRIALETTKLVFLCRDISH